MRANLKRQSGNTHIKKKDMSSHGSVLYFIFVFCTECCHSYLIYSNLYINSSNSCFLWWDLILLPPTWVRLTNFKKLFSRNSIKYNIKTKRTIVTWVRLTYPIFKFKKFSIVQASTKQRTNVGVDSDTTLPPIAIGPT